MVKKVELKLRVEMMKKVNAEDLINWWLEKYHNTNLEKVTEEHPEWKENPSEHTRDFYHKYSVTQEQHDEWLNWAKDYTKKVTKVSKKFFERQWPWVYLDCSPSVIKTKEDEI
jgi:HSP90 family molecular chaperone